ncbi:MAG: hypothetical protein QGH39_07580 [Candidatus Thermoplasmatota archaeon]|nr:hypothetical protein [Candidatus Thermoplasmatota archaeon]MDP7265405.1 hypothetical protein [Candidatus Thermoplasmatota archaeon]
MSDGDEKRPGYKKTKLGWIPEDWGIKRLDQLLIRTRKPSLVREI